MKCNFCGAKLSNNVRFYAKCVKSETNGKNTISTQHEGVGEVLFWAKVFFTSILLNENADKTV
ncbi:MAG: hypothetical protein K2P73_00955 [Lachnospiraceae bacterium]|nr:hypothetical protein [Lachnospiraceae bacterium]